MMTNRTTQESGICRTQKVLSQKAPKNDVSDPNAAPKQHIERIKHGRVAYNSKAKLYEAFMDGRYVAAAETENEASEQLRARGCFAIAYNVQGC